MRPLTTALGTVTLCALAFLAPVEASRNLPSGFQEACWGMSPDQVKKALSKTLKFENKLFTGTILEVENCKIKPGFTRNKLSQVTVTFPQEKTESTWDLLNSLAAHYYIKYGANDVCMIMRKDRPVEFSAAGPNNVKEADQLEISKANTLIFFDWNFKNNGSISIMNGPQSVVVTYKSKDHSDQADI